LRLGRRDAPYPEKGLEEVEPPILDLRHVREVEGAVAVVVEGEFCKVRRVVRPWNRGELDDRAVVEVDGEDSVAEAGTVLELKVPGFDARVRVRASGDEGGSQCDAASTPPGEARHGSTTMGTSRKAVKSGARRSSGIQPKGAIAIAASIPVVSSRSK